GFDMNGAGIHEKYAYDDYGNLKTDPYKKISHISYNHLNLPVKITFTGGETVEYTYLADGTKIEKTATDSENNTTTTEYRDGFQYQNNILEFFPHAEGYVKSTESVNGYIFNYVFTHTDHLGNIRIKYTRHPQTGEIRILEEDHYYPYGLTHEGYSGNHQIFGFDNQTFTLIDVMADETDTYKYKFNGMEWQDEFDVNVYDFGARNYDPALGRWMNIDPMAEMMRRHSPYNYAFNNPVFFMDPDGMSPLVSMASMQTSAVEFYDFSDNGGGSSGGEEDVINPNDPVQLDEVVIGAKGGSSYIDLQDRCACTMEEWQEMTGGKFSSDHALADIQWQVSYGNADQEYFQTQLDEQTAAQHKATGKAAELLSYILPTPLAGGTAISKAPALYKSTINNYR